MTLGTAGYWLAMAGFPLNVAETGEPKSVVLEVPRKNLLTPDTLRALVSGDLKGAPA
jgi:hypothetical protein